MKNTILNFFRIHKWEYKFSHKMDSSFRICKWTGKKQQPTLPNGYKDIKFNLDLWF